jgi:serine/threonine-protein kinase
MSSPSFRRCPTCGIFFRELPDCPNDGTPLIDAEPVIDRYRIIDRLGEGSMGVVYRAQHTLLDERVVAIKLLYRHLANDPTTVGRFFREAKATSQLKNDHIVEVVDFGTSPGGDTFLVMEYLDGLSLRDVLTKEPVLPLHRAVNLVEQIADGLHAAHEHGTVHRDLKPDNVVLVTRGGADCVKLLDFGIAQLAEYKDTRLTQTGIVLGTPGYMSPEQASGEPVDHRTDIYALGTILYEMLVGQCPFQGSTAREVLVRKLTRPVPVPRQLRPEISLAMEAVILHALERNRDLRPASVLQFVDELHDAVRRTGQGRSSRSMPATPPPPVEEPSIDEADGPPPPEPAPRRSESRRGPVARLLPIAGVGLGLALGVVATLLLTRSSGERERGTAAKVEPPTTRPPDARPPPRARDQRTAVATPVLRPDAGRRRKGGPRHPIAVVKKVPAPEVKRAPVVVESKTKAQLVSQPSGAEVFDENEALLGRTPLQVPTGKARKLTVSRLGFDPATVKIPAGASSTFSAKLRKSSASWEAVSLRQLKQMLDQGQISQFTYGRRKKELLEKRNEKLVEARVKLRIGEYTKEQYDRVVKSIEDAYR